MLAGWGGKGWLGGEVGVGLGGLVGVGWEALEDRYMLAGCRGKGWLGG